MNDQRPDDPSSVTPPAAPAAPPPAAQPPVPGAADSDDWFDPRPAVLPSAARKLAGWRLVVRIIAYIYAGLAVAGLALAIRRASQRAGGFTAYDAGGIIGALVVVAIITSIVWSIRRNKHVGDRITWIGTLTISPMLVVAAFGINGSAYGLLHNRVDDANTGRATATIGGTTKPCTGWTADAVMVGATLQDYGRAVTVFGTAHQAAMAEFNSKQETASSLRTRLDAANAAIKALATAVADPFGATPSVTATLAPFRSGVSAIQVAYADYDAWYYGGRDALLGDGDTNIDTAIAALQKAENDASQFLRTIQTVCTAPP